MDGNLEDLIQGIFTQVVEYYKGCISNEVLHDAESNDWLSSNPYYENQKISTCIQFWAYTMQGIRADIFNVLNESLARKALHEITKRSLDILAVRYCQVCKNCLYCTFVGENIWPKRPLSFNFETICDSSNYFNLVNFD